jgi:hypothetical protein
MSEHDPHISTATRAPTLTVIDDKLDGLARLLNDFMAGCSTPAGFVPGVQPRLTALEEAVRELKAKRSWFWDKGAILFASLLAGLSGITSVWDAFFRHAK